VQAASVCSAINIPILTGLTKVESDFNYNNTIKQVVSSDGAEGPTQLIRKYWPAGAGNIWSVYDSEMATAKRLCSAFSQSGSVSAAVESYDPGDPSYSSVVMGYAAETVENTAPAPAQPSTSPPPAQPGGSGGGKYSDCFETVTNEWNCIDTQTNERVLLQKKLSRHLTIFQFFSFIIFLYNC
jgi:hypothetical protein